MRVTVVINRFTELVARQTTTMLIRELVLAGHDVGVSEVADIAQDHGPQVQTTPVIPIAKAIATSTQAIADAIANGASQTTVWEIRSRDLIFIRTSPGRDTARLAVHERFLTLAQRAEQSGHVRVINSPSQLWRMASKDSIQELDQQYYPQTVIAQNRGAVSQAVKRSSPCIIKPLIGSRGDGIMKVDGPRLNSQQAAQVDALLAKGAVLVQEFVDVEEAGDIRVVVVGGSVLQLNGKVAAIRRVPAEGDFRGNLHAGGTAWPVNLTASQMEVANAAADLLHRQGIWLAGVDLVGNKVIELNVFSTGGLHDAERFTGEKFSSEIVRRLAD